MALDVAKLLKKAKAKGTPSAESEAETPAVESAEGDYSCGDRAIAAVKHGDGEAFEQAILDLFAKSK